MVMKRYELTYLIAPELLKEEIEELHEKIKGFITNQGGAVEETKKPIRKRLGYPVLKKKEAILINLDFSLSPDKIEEFDSNIKKEKEIIRHGVFLKKKPRFKKEFVEKKPLENIDKKIDEILKN